MGRRQVATSIDDEKSFGDYFQWGRWDDGHQLKDSEMSEVYPNPDNPLRLGNGNPLFFIKEGSPWMSDYNGWFVNPLQNDTWTAKDVSEVTANKGIDPCKTINDNWEIPTESDWDTVLQKENIFPKPDNTTLGIDRGVKSNLKISGAGARKNETWAFVGIRAYISTKTASTNPNFYRYVYLGTSSYSTTGFGGDAKSHGYSIRCINKTSTLKNRGFNKKF